MSQTVMASVLLAGAPTELCFGGNGPCWWKDVASIVTPAVVFVSALIAGWSVRAAQAIARRRATLDLIEKFESTERYRQINAAFRKARSSGVLARLGEPADDAESKLRRDVVDYLNHYELVAIGIKTRALDASFYRSWMRSALVRDWNAAVGFIQQERWRRDQTNARWIYHRSLYENFQALARQWSAEAVALDEDTVGPIMSKRAGAAASPGNEPLPS